MVRHLIVTCGTSQIEEKRIQKAMEAALAGKSGKDLSTERKTWEKWQNHRKKLLEATEGIDNNAFLQITGKISAAGGQLTEDGQYCEILLSGLIKKWSEMKTVVGTDNNPFGAEISTLYKMEKKSLFTPAKDSVVLLYSDTLSGAFCAGVLYRLLTKVYKMPPANLTLPARIPELREKPRNVVDAEDNTRIALLEARKEDAENMFVMTGGFKSSIPILTVIALLKGDPIYYLFERSDTLRQVDPQATVQSANRWWQFLVPQRKEQNDETSVTLTVKTGKGIAPSTLKPPTP